MVSENINQDRRVGSLQHSNNPAQLPHDKDLLPLEYPAPDQEHESYFLMNDLHSPSSGIFNPNLISPSDIISKPLIEGLDSSSNTI